MLEWDNISENIVQKMYMDHKTTTRGRKTQAYHNTYFNIGYILFERQFNSSLWYIRERNVQGFTDVKNQQITAPPCSFHYETITRHFLLCHGYKTVVEEVLRLFSILNKRTTPQCNKSLLNQKSYINL